MLDIRIPDEITVCLFMVLATEPTRNAYYVQKKQIWVVNYFKYGTPYKIIRVLITKWCNWRAATSGKTNVIWKMIGSCRIVSLLKTVITFTRLESELNGPSLTEIVLIPPRNSTK